MRGNKGRGTGILKIICLVALALLIGVGVFVGMNQLSKITINKTKEDNVNSAPSEEETGMIVQATPSVEPEVTEEAPNVEETPTAEEPQQAEETSAAEEVPSDMNFYMSNYFQEYNGEIYCSVGMEQDLQGINGVSTFANGSSSNFGSMIVKDDSIYKMVYGMNIYDWQLGKCQLNGGNLIEVSQYIADANVRFSIFQNVLYHYVRGGEAVGTYRVDLASGEEMMISERILEMIWMTESQWVYEDTQSQKYYVSLPNFENEQEYSWSMEGNVAQHSEYPDDRNVFSDGSYLYYGDLDGVLHRIALESGEEVLSLSMSDYRGDYEDYFVKEQKLYLFRLGSGITVIDLNDLSNVEDISLITDVFNTSMPVDHRIVNVLGDKIYFTFELNGVGELNRSTGEIRRIGYMIGVE